MKELSIIIPVYNGEKHIINCYNSIKDQTFQSFEIIFINDGSTDSSEEIINTIKANDTRVISFTQTNKGVSVARNKGIELASKEFIAFLDIDDLIKNDFYETLLNNLKDNDLIVSNILFERDNKLIPKTSVFEYGITYHSDVIKKNIVQQILCFEDLSLIPVYNKIYRKSYLDQHNIRFIEGMSVEEDGTFNAKVLSLINTMIFIDYAGYIYQENEESVTRKFITNNIFEKNKSKIDFDYKAYLDVDFSKEEMKQFQSSRFIYAITFLIFKALTLKNITTSEKYKYIWNIVSDKYTTEAIQNLHPHYLGKRSKFEWIISKVIASENKLLIKLLIFLFNFLNNPFVIKILRLINKKNI